MEREIQEHEEDTKAISNLVLGARVFSSHSSKARGSNDHSNESGDVHLATGVDPIVQPGAKRVVDATL